MFEQTTPALVSAVFVKNIVGNVNRMWYCNSFARNVPTLYRFCTPVNVTLRSVILFTLFSTSRLWFATIFKFDIHEGNEARQSSGRLNNFIIRYHFPNITVSAYSYRK
ncbi:uncharacterized protein LOC125499715 [Athalia rosae]|uniref:uncharacterized protein LOC125499715 n=1 Tax=Athalia rosae TaxID=37344 RepID=UPI00203491F0|nr:uncharacterized protein LOC125499715 [Athalia rosae]